MLSMLLLLMLTACKTEQAPSSADLPSEPSSVVPPEPEEYSISLITDGAYDFWYRMKAGCEQAITDLKEQNVNINFTFDPPEHNMDIPEWKYEEIVGDENNKRDAILITPVIDPYEEMYKEATGKGIKTVLLYSTVKNAYWDAAYMTDYYNDGRIAAKEMLKRLEVEGISSGKICMIGVNTSTEITCVREKGFRAVFEGTDYELMETAYFDGDSARESEYIQELIDNGEAENIVGYVGFQESATRSIPKALSEQPYDPDDPYKHITPVVVGFDASEYTEILGYYKSGTLDISINTDPYQMGYQGMMGAVELLRGNEIDPKIVDVAPVVVTSDNYLQYFAKVDRQVKSVID